MRARRTLGWGFVALAITLSLASLANPHDDAPPTVQESPPGHHNGWDKGGNPHGNPLDPDTPPPVVFESYPLTPQAGAGIYTSDYYVGNGPIHLSGSKLRQALGADARRP